MTPLSISLSLCAPYWSLSLLATSTPSARPLHDNSGWTPIHYATRQNAGDVAEMLVRIDPEIAKERAVTRSADGRTYTVRKGDKRG